MDVILKLMGIAAYFDQWLGVSFVGILAILNVYVQIEHDCINIPKLAIQYKSSGLHIIQFQSLLGMHGINASAMYCSRRG